MTGARANDVHIDLSARVLRVVEVEQHLAADHTDRDRCDIVRNRKRGRELSIVVELSQSEHQRNKGAGYRSRAGSSIRLDNVAVEIDCALADPVGLNNSSQRTADEPLNFLCAARKLNAARFALRSRFSGARQHGVFGGDPSFSSSALKHRYPIVNRRGAYHAGLAHLDEHRAFGVSSEPRCDSYLSKLIMSASRSFVWH